MVDFSQVLDVVVVLGAVVGVTGAAYAYYSNEKVRAVANKVLPFLPMLFQFAASRAPDTKGVFDLHDTWVVLGRVSKRLQGVLQSTDNPSFDDVQDDVFAIVTEELKRYRDAGVKNVPDVSDETVRVQVRVVFEAVKRATSENTTGSNP